MAPPTPVYDRLDILSKYEHVLSDPKKYNCSLKSISQNECTFKISYPNQVPNVICLPFKREFQRCLLPTTVIKDGKKTQSKKWVNIEITDEYTNKKILYDPSYEFTVKEFLQADKDLRKMLESEEEL